MAKIDYHDGIPVDRLKDLETQGITEYRLKIARRGDGGVIQSLKTAQVTLAEMSNLEDTLTAYAGGGTYIIQAFHPEESLNRLFAFRLSIVGTPKIPADRVPPGASNRAAANPEGPRTMQSQLFAVPTPEEPGGTFGPPLMSSGRYPTHASHTPDQIALNQVQDERLQRRQLEAKFDALQKELEAERVANSKRLEDERKERDRIAMDAERARHAAELRRLEDLITNKPKGLDIAGIIAATTPLVPVAVALIDARKHSTYVEADRISKMNEIQMQGANRLMEATLAQGKNDAGGTSKLLETVVPLAVPIITTLLTSSGPKAQAELMATQADVQMQQIAMLAQMIEQVTASAPESPYIPLIQSAMDTIASGVQAYARAQARPSAAQAVAATIAQHLGSGAPAQPAEAQQATAPGQRTPGEQVADSVFAHPAYPDEMKTQEWFTIIAMLHDKAPVDVVSQAIADHLRNLDGAGTTPAYLEPVWTDPEKTLSRVLSFLPIWQAQPLYARQVIAAVIVVLSAPVPEEDEDAGEEEGDEENDDDDGDEETVDTAASAPAGGMAAI